MTYKFELVRPENALGLESGSIRVECIGEDRCFGRDYAQRSTDRVYHFNNDGWPLRPYRLVERDAQVYCDDRNSEVEAALMGQWEEPPM
jgi:hypothetical protein